MTKKMLKSEQSQRLASFLLSLWLRFIYLTARVRIQMHEGAAPYMKGEKQAIFCFWHGRMILQPFIKPPRRKMRVLISHHRDGELITSVIRHFGIGTVRGSSSKGGSAAIRELIGVLKAGDNITITPDGPKGPAYVAQQGAAYIAQRMGMPLIPASFGTTRGKRFDSWDNFLLPHPFARVVFVIGAPLQFDKTEELERVSTVLADAINATMQEADRKTAA